MKDMKELIKELESTAETLCDVPMAEHTTFKAGGKADAMVIPKNEEELQEVLRYLSGSGIDYYVMGKGSNILVKDGGYRGVIVKIAEGFDNIEVEMPAEGSEDAGNVTGAEEVTRAGDAAGNAADAASPGKARIKAGPGVSLAALSKEAMRNSLTGLEFASGIPGSLGGAMYMNAGAYDGEMKQIVRKCRVITRDGSGIKDVDVVDMDLGYRHSAFQETGDVVVSVEIELEKGDRSAIEQKMKELAERRNAKQPVQYPSAGSFFKRPPGYYAGKLVQDAGMKGMSVGGAQVSTLHSGFVINTGGATATDIIQLMHIVQGRVKEKFGVDLEPEVRIIGED
jgi:UDP-N-acetylmuramate dehydrogenase